MNRNIERLEDRCLMAASAVLVGGELTVTGTRRSDEIVVELDSADSTKLVVMANGQETVFNLDEIDSLKINTGNGNDIVTVSEANGKIFLPVTVKSGNGNDVIETGSGDDVILAGNGRDIVDAGSGDDQIAGGTGKDELTGGDDNDILLGGNGKDNISAGDGDDNVDGGTSRDTIDLGDGSNAVAVDRSNKSEANQYDEEEVREYRVAKLKNFDRDLRLLVQEAIPGTKVSRVEVDGTTVTVMYQFGSDPKYYKLVLDTGGEEIELVSREVSVDELRDSARAVFLELFPGAIIRSAFQRPGSDVDIRFSDQDGEMHTGNVDGLVWTLDDADGDANNDGWHDDIPLGEDGMPDDSTLDNVVQYED